jgi:two-component system chemotaxis response regulator CheY
MSFNHRLNDSTTCRLPDGVSDDTLDAGPTTTLRRKFMEIQIGKKINALRKKNNLTQESLAAEMGVSIAAVSKWETGNSLPDLYTLCAIADFFQVSTDELLGRTGYRKKLIIVDDAEFMRHTLKDILLHNGCDVVGEATDGAELFRLMEKKIPDAITLDINMPGMDGMTALRSLRANHPEIKVIMISAMDDPGIIREAMTLGASGYVLKPFKPEDVVSRLASL